MSTAAIIAGTVGSVAAGAMSMKGASDQANAATKSSQTAIAEQQREFDLNQKNQAPWLNAGTNAVNKLQELLGLGNAGSGNADYGSLNKNFSASDFQTDPGYDFRLSQGAQALERSAAAKGSVLSGGTLKALTQYNQDFASNEYSNAYNRFQTNKATNFNQLASVSGYGQTAANQLGVTGQAAAQNIGDLTVGGATAAAAARASGYGAIGSSISSASQIPMNWYMLSQMNKSAGTSGGGSPYPGGGYSYPGVN